MKDEKLDITKYTSYFHDGEVLEIIHRVDKIELVMKSAEIDPDRIIGIQLSEDNRIVGKLHISDVEFVINNGKKLNKKLRILYPDNDLLHLRIADNVVYCEIGWRGSKPGEIDFSDLEIHAKKIWWENLPNQTI